MSHGPMVSAATLLRVKRERDCLLWLLTLVLAGKLPGPRARAPAPPSAVIRAGKPRAVFDFKMRQAGERDAVEDD